MSVLQFIFRRDQISYARRPSNACHSLILIISIWCTFGSLLIALVSGVPPDTPYWLSTDAWSACSAPCGEGVEKREFLCVSQNLFKSTSILDPKLCANLSQPDDQPNERKCTLGSCRGGYRWKVFDWGHCSQTCGGRGLMSRDVQCVYAGKDDEISVPEADAAYFCGNYPQPARDAPCNRIDCSPTFVPERWGKVIYTNETPQSAGFRGNYKKRSRCIQSDPCRPGRQVRQLSCIAVLVNGTHHELPMAACYMSGQLPKPTWRRCFEISAGKCDTKPPVINTDTLTIVQMRKVKSIDLKVGQQAFLIPFTRVTVRCPVQYFSAQELQWIHPNQGQFFYDGATSNRVRVDKRGRLQIKSFRIADEGEWTCRAGQMNATVTLTARTPASGFHDWVQRNRLWTKGMLSDDPKSLVLNQEIVQWVEGPWSACSTSCGQAGRQYRVVRCEKVDSRLYHILDDKVCEEKLLPKPASQRKCLQSNKCPQWVVEDRDATKCTNHCLDVGQGSIGGNITCRIGSRIVEEKYCPASEKPDMSCPNPACQLKWNVGPWSQCSRSCGGVGVQARELLCVWNENEKSAGSLCYDRGIEVPEVIRPCDSPPCNLDCVDFSKHCPNKPDLCKFTIYRYQCCATCQKYAQRNRT